MEPCISERPVKNVGISRNDRLVKYADKQDNENDCKRKK